ncbi:MAG: SGNH/GDSL hydrolase family protein [Cyanobacteria bacterium P01_G01_bin.49]
MLKSVSSSIPNLVLTSSFALAVGTFFPTTTLASSFSKIYVFSDSLSDAGNALLITEAANASDPSIPIIPPAALGYVDGQFANGDIWVDRLANRLGLNSPPVSFLVGGDNENGVNFAINSATTGSLSTFPLPLPGFVGLEQQIDQFQADNSIADPNALYILWAGANDYLGGGVVDPSEPVMNLSSAVEQLYNLGSRRFLVANLPALGQTPLAISRGNDVVNGLNQVTAGHNFLLSESLQTLSFLPGINLNLLDVASLFERTITQPDDFGFSFVDVPCLANSPLLNPPSTIPSICNNPEQYIFWDDLHPSAATHELIGDLAFQTLSVPETSPIVGVLAFGTLIATIRILKG